MGKDDIVKLDVPLFIRLLELSREDIKSDAPIHFVAEIVTQLSQNKVVTMNDYQDIIDYVNKHTEPDAVAEMKRLGGI